MKTAATKVITVKLQYDFAHDTLTTKPRKPVLKKGDRVKFDSSQGDVHVLLRPIDQFDPPEFKKGDGPVTVKKNGKGEIWCGGTYRTEGIIPGPRVVKIAPKENGPWGSQTTDHKA